MPERNIRPLLCPTSEGTPGKSEDTRNEKGHANDGGADVVKMKLTRGHLRLTTLRCRNLRGGVMS